MQQTECVIVTRGLKTHTQCHTLATALRRHHIPYWVLRTPSMRMIVFRPVLDDDPVDIVSQMPMGTVCRHFDGEIIKEVRMVVTKGGDFKKRRRKIR